MRSATTSFTQRRGRGIASRQLRTRRPQLERLEPRQLLAVDISPAPFVQWFEASYDTIIDRAPDLFEAGYGAVWTPPPTRGDTGDLTVGYDVYDRFDLGQWDKPTLYGTEEGLKTLADVLGEAGVSLHVDFIMNHNGFSTLSTPGFVEAGGYPGLSITEPFDIDGDFHGAFYGGPEYERLAGLIDIAQEKNYQFIRTPVDPNNPLNIRAGTQDAFGRIANVPDPNNARFYPDIGYNTIFVFDPATGEQNIPVHSFNPDNPLAGDATPENALGFLMRNAQWLVQTIGVDGLRIDAGKHMQGFVFDFLDRAVFRANPRPLLDGSPQHVFSYTEVFDANPDILLPHVKKTIDPNDPGRIGGNRDTVDFKWYFAVKDNLEQYGQGGAWFNVKDAGLDVAHNGFHDGSAGVKFVQNHDVFKPFKLHNVATALQLMLPGNAVVYFNGKEFGDNRDFPKDGRGDSLSLDSVTSKLVEIRESHGKGNYAERWVDNEGIYIFERVSNAVVALSNRGDGGFDERTVQVGFAPGTHLVELTGNASDPNVDPFDDIPEVVTVFQGGDGNSYATIRVPRNLSATGFEHQKGFVIYGLGTPQPENGSLELIGVDSVLAGDTNINNNFENGTKRQSDIHVVTADSLQVRLQTNEVRHLGLDSLRDIFADGDNAFLKLDGGEDINGNGFVDFVTPGSDVYGFEGFGDKSSPLIGPGGIGGPRGDGEFLQTIDTTQLEEGIHFLEARAFRHRTDGGPATYGIFKETIYVDRLAPDTGVFEIRSVNSLNSGDHDVVFESLDSTADSVHAFANLPASVTDAEIIAMATSGQGAASKVDVDHYKTFFGGLGEGNNVWTVVTFESTGTTNVQRITGQSIGDHGQGGGLGDLDRNFLINVTDIDWFAGLLSSGDTLFNPSADFNGDGLITEVDTQLLGDRLIEVGADQATMDAYQALINGGASAGDDAYGTNEDGPLSVNAANGVLQNDGGLMNATVQSGPFNAQSFQLFTDGSFNYTPNSNYNGPDSFIYQVDDGDGNFDTASVSLTISPLNDTPDATGTSTSTDQNVDLDVDLRALVDDVETADDQLLFSVGGASNGSVQLLGDGYTARFTPATDFAGPASFTYDVTDGGDNGDPAITVGPIAISISVNSLIPPAADLFDPANGASVLASVFDTKPYIEVTFSDNDDGLNLTWINGDELLLSGSGLGSVTLDGTPAAQGNGKYRYPISGEFVPGDVDVTFVAGTFADVTGNTNVEETESFTVAVPHSAQFLDNGDAGFSTSGTWTHKPSPGIPGYQTDIHYAVSGGGSS
ncbi:MAG: Ig-like domain-containing protein, partial [Pirellulales bacterium]